MRRGEVIIRKRTESFPHKRDALWGKPNGRTSAQLGEQHFYFLTSCLHLKRSKHSQQRQGLKGNRSGMWQPRKKEGASKGKGKATSLDKHLCGHIPKRPLTATVILHWKIIRHSPCSEPHSWGRRAVGWAQWIRLKGLQHTDLSQGETRQSPG